MVLATHPDPGETLPPGLGPVELETLEEIERRVLWLSTAIVHHANAVRPNPEKTKVGGHQASSASVVSIMTALYFHLLRSGDRVSIKPHASPAFHACQYLLGRLDRAYLTTLREFGGLQAYPSRTKDPDPVDFSTGSVGLGAVAPIFAALAHRYNHHHFGDTHLTSGRFVSLLGDAELDEGNVWEAVAEEAIQGLGNVIWIVDLNRQSLDRVIPGVRASRLKALFAGAGWVVLEAKYSGYIDRQAGDVERFRKMEHRLIPAAFDYAAVPQLRTEAREKLGRVRPASLGQASRVSGVTPADLAVLLFYLD